MNETWCVDGRRKNHTLNQNLYERINPGTQKVFETIKGVCSVCGRNKSQIFNK